MDTNHRAVASLVGDKHLVLDTNHRVVASLVGDKHLVLYTYHRVVVDRCRKLKVDFMISRHTSIACPRPVGLKIVIRYYAVLQLATIRSLVLTFPFI